MLSSNTSVSLMLFRSGADLLVCAGPPGPAPRPAGRPTADREVRPTSKSTGYTRFLSRTSRFRLRRATVGGAKACSSKSACSR